jgi:hypothetical protein
MKSEFPNLTMELVCEKSPLPLSSYYDKIALTSKPGRAGTTKKVPLT